MCTRRRRCVFSSRLRGSIYRVGSQRRVNADVTQKAIGKTCVQSAQSAERVSSDPFWHSAEQIMHGRAAPAPPHPPRRVTIICNVNTPAQLRSRDESGSLPPRMASRERSFRVASYFDRVSITALWSNVHLSKATLASTENLI